VPMESRTIARGQTLEAVREPFAHAYRDRTAVGLAFALICYAEMQV